MNAAARLVHKKALTRHLALSQLLSKKQIALLILSVVILVSSIGLIYTSHLARDYFSEYQIALNETHELQTLHSQLLLERSTLTSEAKVETTALKKLQMMAPNAATTVTIRE